MDPDPPASVCQAPASAEQGTRSSTCGAGLQGSVAVGDRVASSRVTPEPPSLTVLLAQQFLGSSPARYLLSLGALPGKEAEVLAPVISKLSEKLSCSDIIPFLCYYKELRSCYGRGGNSIEPFKINSDRKRDTNAWRHQLDISGELSPVQLTHMYTGARETAAPSRVSGVWWEEWATSTSFCAAGSALTPSVATALPPECPFFMSCVLLWTGNHRGAP